MTGSGHIFCQPSENASANARNSVYPERSDFSQCAFFAPPKADKNSISQKEAFDGFVVSALLGIFPISPHAAPI